MLSVCVSSAERIVVKTLRHELQHGENRAAVESEALARK